MALNINFKNILMYLINLFEMLQFDSLLNKRDSCI